MSTTATDKEAAATPYPLHGGRLIGRILKDNGIDYVFGIQGGHIHSFETGFHDYGIKRIHMRHEQAGVYAADAYARCKRQPGVCYGTAGPGMTNMVSGINQAWLVRSPIVALFGQHRKDLDSRRPLQEAYGPEVCKTMSKWGTFIEEWRLIPFYLRKALRECMIYPPGPVVIAMEPRALYNVADEKTLVGDVPNSVKAAPSPAAGDPRAVERAVSMLLKAERPAIVGGDGVFWADAAAELKELAELLQVPTNTRRLGRGALPEDHPLAVGSAWRLQFWSDADVVLIIGLALDSNLENNGVAPSWPANPKRIVVQESAVDAWAPLPVEVEIIGSPKLVLRQMIDCAKGTMKGTPQRAAWLEHMRRVREDYQRASRGCAMEMSQHKPIHGFWLAQEIVDFLDPSATIIYDSYSGSSHLSGRIKAKFAGQVLDGGEAAGVGHGIGMGIGAQLARPGKQVFVMMGDGGIGIAGMDIETAVRYKLPIVYLIYNNSTWMGGIEHIYMRGQMDSWGMLPDIRYDKMFEILGCHGENVTEPKEIRPALERAFNSGKTAVVNVMVDSRVPIASMLAPSWRSVVAKMVDVDKLPEETRELFQKGPTPEVEEALMKKGWPMLSPKGKVGRGDVGRPGLA